MLEPAVTLTNLVLVLECWAFAWRLAGSADTTLSWFSRLFALLGLGALMGGITHGFVPESSALANRVVWSGNMLALGGAGVAAGMIAAHLTLAKCGQHGAALVIGLLALAYAATVIFLTQDFLLALVAAVPPVIWLIVAILGQIRRAPRPGLWPSALGFGLNLLAGVQQQLRIGVDPVWFNHNTLFHVIEMLAFWLIYRGCRAVAGAAQDQAASRT